MQRFLTWLGTRLFSTAPEAKSRSKLRDTNPALRVVPRQVPPRPRPVEAKPIAAAEPTLVDFDAELGCKIEDGGPGKNVLVRNKYLREDTGTHETLKIIDESLIDTGETAGFDPYNTGQFDRAKNWKTRTRE